MQYCKNEGIRIPDDLAVMGYNGLDIGLTMQPKLTSVVTPRQAIGIKSARLLIDVINGKPASDKLFDLGFSYTEGESLS